MIWAALTLAAATPAAASVDAAVMSCALRYRRAMEGNSRPAPRFDCATRSAAAAGATNTVAIVATYRRAAQAGRRFIDLQVHEAEQADPKAFPAGRLEALAARRAEYRLALCSAYGGLTGGTVDQSNAAVCEARDVDAQIDDLLALMRESGVIPNGR